MQRASCLVLFLGVALAACSSTETSESLAKVGQTIVGGWSADDDANVVALVSAAGVVCSGTLVAERIVITAAHCGALAPTAVAFEGGGLPARVSVSIATFDAHPEFDEQTLENDLAMVTLVERAPAAAVNHILPVSEKAFTSEQNGSGLRIVGYGRASASDDAIRQQGWVSISVIAPTTLKTVPGPSQPCHGDSGGPAFAWIDGAQVLAGVISSGDPACADHANVIRVDAFIASFVRPMLAAMADGAARVGQRCYHPDNCVADAQCFTGGASSGYAYCTRACDAQSACLPGMTCTAQPAGSDPASLCLFPKPPGESGAACIVDTDCNSLHCARRGDAALCAETCIPHVIPCAGTLQCLPDEAHPAHYACFDVPVPAVAMKPAPTAAPAGNSRAPQSTTDNDAAMTNDGGSGGCTTSGRLPLRNSSAWLVFGALAVVLGALRRRRPAP